MAPTSPAESDTEPLSPAEWRDSRDAILGGRQSPDERAEVREVLNSPEHVDEATVYAKLLDEGTYLASKRTMYRILADHDEVRERRRQATHPAASNCDRPPLRVAGAIAPAPGVSGAAAEEAAIFELQNL